MRHLTELCIGQVDLDVPGIRETLFGLSNLKSLGFGSRTLQDFPLTTYSIQDMTGLTKLDADYIFTVASICQLSDLVTLRVLVYHDFHSDCPALNMKLLEELDIRIFIVSEYKILSNLPRLKRLCLREEDPENGDFFTTLGRLPQLTHFRFVGRLSHDQLPLDYCLQFSLLSGLRSLSICVTSGHPEPIPDPFDFLLKGSFPLLRRLDLEGYELSPDEEHELMERFPCLNSVNKL